MDSALRRRPIPLDLFCGAGGCTRGFQDAGFEVIGVDKKLQPHYCGHRFVLADAIEFLERLVAGGTWEFIGPGILAGIHASPPCQAYSSTRTATGRTDHPELVPPVRELLQALHAEWDLPYSIENVPGAPLINPVKLCGSGFGLPVVKTRDGRERRLYRHRLFECSFPVMGVPCSHTHPALGVYGHGPWGHASGDPRRGGYQGTAAERAEAMGIDWMNRDELSQAIPPVYAEHIGLAMLAHIEATTGIRAT